MRGTTDQRSMAGTAPTDFQFTKMRNAGPVHCGVWLARGGAADNLREPHLRVCSPETLHVR